MEGADERRHWKQTRRKREKTPCRATDGCVLGRQRQEQIWRYRNRSTKSSGLSHGRGCGSHIFGHSNKSLEGRHRLRLCQQTRAIQSPRARRCDWLTSAHLITVLLFTNENTKTHQVYSVFVSQPVFAVCCRVFLAAWVNPRRSRQTNGQMSSVLAPLSSFTSDWLEAGYTELLHTSQSVLLWTRAHIHAHTLMNAPQIFRCEHTSTTTTEGAMFIHSFCVFFFVCFFLYVCCSQLQNLFSGFSGTLQLVMVYSDVYFIIMLYFCPALWNTASWFSTCPQSVS